MKIGDAVLNLRHDVPVLFLLQVNCLVLFLFHGFCPSFVPILCGSAA